MTNYKSLRIAIYERYRDVTDMAKKAKQLNERHLKVKYTEANRLRSILLSEETQTLSKRDVQTLLRILDDVYPVQDRKPHLDWKPLLVGIGIGIILVLGLTIIL